MREAKKETQKTRKKDDAKGLEGMAQKETQVR